MTVILETPRLLLRWFTEDDADHLFALDSDPEVMRYVGPHGLGSVAAYREHVRVRLLPAYARDERYGLWAALEKASGDFLGWFHLRPALEYRFAAEAGYAAGELDLGYRLRRAAWGKGHATEVSLALVRRAFADPDVVRVVATALVSNVASTRVMEKVGMKKEKLFALPGYEIAAVKYALSREEFVA
jgi:[ribosomal protein S5]-alanine N-acetyltransferase